MSGGEMVEDRWSFQRAGALTVGLALLLALCAACNPTPARGEFDVDTLVYGSCSGEDLFPWEPEFYTIDRFEDTLTIRLQSQAGGIQSLDGIFIQLDRAYVEARINEPILLGLPNENGQLPARALVGFYESCPGAPVVPELVGTIVFEFFEPHNDGQITARLNAPVVMDARTGDVIGVNFTGRFSFKVQKGRPYTNFTGPGQE